MNKPQHGVCTRGDDRTRTLPADAKPAEGPGFAGRENGSPGLEPKIRKRGKRRGDGAVAAVVADDMPRQAGLSKPEMVRQMRIGV
jgi:hypothetical protein